MRARPAQCGQTEVTQPMCDSRINVGGLLVAVCLWYACGAGAQVAREGQSELGRPQQELMGAALRAEYPLHRAQGRLQFGLAIYRAHWTLGEPIHLRVYVGNDGPAAVSAPLSLAWPRGFELFVGLQGEELSRWLPLGYPADVVDSGPPVPTTALAPAQGLWREWWVTLTRAQEAEIAAKGGARLLIAAEDRRGAWEGVTTSDQSRTQPLAVQVAMPQGRDAKAYQFLVDHKLVPLPGPDDPGHWLDLQQEEDPLRILGAWTGTKLAFPDDQPWGQEYENGLLVFLGSHRKSVYAPYVHWLVAKMAAGPLGRREGPDPVEAEGADLRIREHYRAVAESGLPGLADQAWYEVANAEWRLGNYQDSIATFERLVHEFAGSPWAAQAREDLPRLRQLAKVADGNETSDQ